MCMCLFRGFRRGFSLVFKRSKDSCGSFTMFKCLNLLLLLLFCFVYQREILSAGNPLISVSGKKRGSVTLTCEHETNNIVQIKLITRSRDIDVCQTEECSGRVFKEGNCDVVIKNLSFSDAGKYFLHLYYNNDQTELERQIRTYQLHIHDEISVKTGEELKMSVLLSNADKVKTKSSGEWKEVWKRGHGVWSDRMIDDNDGNLIIKAFLDSDAGTYRVLDSEGEILITVTITAEENTVLHHSARQHWSWVEKLLFGFVTSVFFAYIVIIAVEFLLVFAGII
ncbi:uncharacterized protein LOC109091668 [Cyprinus carpio]|uniref:Uncharacterized protein LOC109091668 n=1 Tax=Cyprinus carpio TaxID=7962 RepID=A0A9Q9XID6_CYPCA|nr:uncharacterized protein LOC109091668 [Cyprinus carpio]